MKTLMAVLISVVILSLFGCARTYTPSVYPKFETIPEFSSKASIKLINNQPSTTPVKYASQGGSTWTTDLNEWTRIAIIITDRELSKRGMLITNDISRTLSLSVESADLEIGFVTSTSLVGLHVETSNGYSAKYTGKNKSGRPFGVTYLGDGALMRAVVEMLRDPEIIAFLKQSGSQHDSVD